MTAHLGGPALAVGDRVRKVTETDPLDERFGTATVLSPRQKLGRTGLKWWVQIEHDTGGGTNDMEPFAEWLPEHHVVLVRRVAAPELEGVASTRSR